MNALVQHQERVQSVGVFGSMAERFGMDVTAFERTVMATLMPANVSPSREMVAAFLLVAKQYNLNPFTKEIFAFPAKGGIQPVVSVDGWMKLINSQPDFDGMEFQDKLDEAGQLLSITCRMFRKERSHPVEVTEYMAECKRNTDTWRQWPARMLRHKAAIQCARYAFGFAGIMEPDEAERMIDAPESHEQQLARRKAECMQAFAEHQESMAFIKTRLDANDGKSALAEWYLIPERQRDALWLAPSKGGVLTTKQRQQLIDQIEIERKIYAASPEAQAIRDAQEYADEAAAEAARKRALGESEEA